MWDLIVAVPDHCISFYFPCGANENVYWPHTRVKKSSPILNV